MCCCSYIMLISQRSKISIYTLLSPAPPTSASLTPSSPISFRPTPFPPSAAPLTPTHHDTVCYTSNPLIHNIPPNPAHHPSPASLQEVSYSNCLSFMRARSIISVYKMLWQCVNNLLKTKYDLCAYLVTFSTLSYSIFS